MASGSNDATIRVWDPRSGVCQKILDDHNGAVYCVTASHDSRRLASASRDKTIKIWETGSWSCLATLRGHVDRVWAAAFSRDDRVLFSGALEPQVKVWPLLVPTGHCQVVGHTEEIFSVCISPDGALIGSATGDRKPVYIWQSTTGQILGFGTKTNHPKWWINSGDSEARSQGVLVRAEQAQLFVYRGDLLLWNSPQVLVLRSPSLAMAKDLSPANVRLFCDHGDDEDDEDDDVDDGEDEDDVDEEDGDAEQSE